jgi:hypothetical protein
VLNHPELPLTNNIAELALRHWVIARRISYGTRNPQGSRAFTLLASVVETCRQRGHSPWLYTLPRPYASATGAIPLPFCLLPLPERAQCDHGRIGGGTELLPQKSTIFAAQQTSCPVTAGPTSPVVLTPAAPDSSRITSTFFGAVTS